MTLPCPMIGTPHDRTPRLVHAAVIAPTGSPARRISCACWRRPPSSPRSKYMYARIGTVQRVLAFESFLPTHLPTYQPTYFLTFPPTYLPTCLRTYLRSSPRRPRARAVPAASRASRPRSGDPPGAVHGTCLVRAWSPHGCRARCHDGYRLSVTGLLPLLATGWRRLGWQAAVCVCTCRGGPKPP